LANFQIAHCLSFDQLTIVRSEAAVSSKLSLQQTVFQRVTPQNAKLQLLKSLKMLTKIVACANFCKIIAL